MKLIKELEIGTLFHHRKSGESYILQELKDNYAICKGLLDNELYFFALDDEVEHTF